MISPSDQNLNLKANPDHRIRIVLLLILLLALGLTIWRLRFWTVSSANVKLNVTALEKPGNLEPCASVYSTGTGRDGKEVCPWDNVDASFSRQMEAFRDVHIAILGDSRMRYLFWTVISGLIGKDSGYGGQRDYKYYFKDRNLTLDFYWHAYPDGYVTNRLRDWVSGKYRRPQHVILAVGVWTALFQYKHPKIVRSFTDQVKEIGRTFAFMPETSFTWIDILPWHQRVRDEIPAVGATLDRLRDASAHIATRQNYIHFWSSARTLCRAHMEFFVDHHHFTGKLLKTVACQLMAATNRLNC